jgi:hypothetical protein
MIEVGDAIIENGGTGDLEKLLEETYGSLEKMIRRLVLKGSLEKMIRRSVLKGSGKWWIFL